MVLPDPLHAIRSLLSASTDSTHLEPSCGSKMQDQFCCRDFFEHAKITPRSTSNNFWMPTAAVPTRSVETEDSLQFLSGSYEPQETLACNQGVDESAPTKTFSSHQQDSAVQASVHQCSTGQVKAQFRVGW